MTRFSPAEAAATLLRLAESPQFAGRTWTWESIGSVLGLNIRQAREVIAYIRKNATDMVWTVGTYDTDYSTMPTTSTRDAWPGLLNQLRHLQTRLTTMAHTWEVLAKVDPDPQYARVAGREGRAYRRWQEDVEDRIDHLLTVFGEDTPPLVTV